MNQNILTNRGFDENGSSIIKSEEKGYYIVNNDGYIQHYNTSANKLFAFSKNRIKTIESFIKKWTPLTVDGSPYKPEDNPILRGLYLREECKEIRMGFMDPKNKIVWLSVDIKQQFKTGHSEKDYTVSFYFTRMKDKAEDVTVHKESELLVKTYFQNSLSACFIYDEEGTVLYGNNHFWEKTLFPSGADGEKLTVVFPLKIAKKIIERNKVVFNSNKPFVSYQEMLDVHGKSIEYLINLSIVQLTPQKKAIVGQSVDISKINLVKQRLLQSEHQFNAFMKYTPAFAWVYDVSGNLLYGNNNFLNTINQTEQAIGKNISEITASKEIEMLVTNRMAEVVRNKKNIIAEDVLPDAQGRLRTYLSNWFLLDSLNGDIDIAGQAIDITDIKEAYIKIGKIQDRFHYAVNATSDAIWDLDLITNDFFISDSFSELSGYPKEEITLTIDWFMSKIHPEDKLRIHNGITGYLKERQTTWHGEYRFMFADGKYYFLSDKRYAVYNNNKAVRLVGALKNITDKKEIELKLMEERIQKEKEISRAIINAQEKERAEISGELHDNVNQLIASTKLYIEMAMKSPEERNTLLKEAVSYLLTANEEIRVITKKLNSSVIKITGLQNSVSKICENLTTLNNIQCSLQFDDKITTVLTEEQQLAVYRIVQEQTTNIIKYAHANKVEINVSTQNDICSISVADNGVGMDINTKKDKGIGLLNIMSRVNTFNGDAKIDTAPGKGFNLHAWFPINNSI